MSRGSEDGRGPVTAMRVPTGSYQLIRLAIGVNQPGTDRSTSIVPPIITHPDDRVCEEGVSQVMLENRTRR